MVEKRGRPKNPPTPKEILKNLMPVDEMFDEDEIPIYNSLIDIYLKDFDTDELTSSDIDDIMTLSTNKVLEVRLMKGSKGNAGKHLDMSQGIERLRKNNEKIKENLSSRRKDRIDPNEFKGFSIVDLAVAFDDAKKAKLEEKARKLKAEQDEFIDKLESSGNKNDIDSISTNG